MKRRGGAQTAWAETFGVCRSDGNIGSVIVTPAVRMKRRRERRPGSREGWGTFFIETRSSTGSGPGGGAVAPTFQREGARACMGLPDVVTLPYLLMPASQLTRTALVLGLRRGESSASRLFFETYRDLVERVLRRILGSTDEVDDLLNEVMLSAVEAIHALRDPKALPGWVVGIAANAARKK